MKKVAIMGLATLLALSARAELKHFYTYTSGDMRTDTVGGLDGAIAGTAQIVDGALVTDKAGGQWAGEAANSMTLPEGVVSGINGAFSIMTWAFVNDEQDAAWCTMFSFSDTTTANWLMLQVAHGNGGLEGKYNGTVGLSQASAESERLYNFTDWNDNGFYAFDDNLLHNIVYTYDGGTTARLYVDGVLQDTQPTQNPVTLSDWTAVGVNGGSPWSDRTMSGTTYAFGILDNELTADQVTALFNLGKDATTDDVQGAIGGAVKTLGLFFVY